MLDSRWQTSGPTHRWCAATVWHVALLLTRVTVNQVIMYVSFVGIPLTIYATYYMATNVALYAAPVPLALIYVWYNFIWMGAQPGD